MFKEATDYEVRVPLDGILLEGDVHIPKGVKGIVIFVHGSGSSRLSPRNQYVAKVLQKEGIGTLLIDLLTVDEDSFYNNRFDIDLLTKRVITITTWLQKQVEGRTYTFGYFGASTGAAAAINAAVALEEHIKAIVSRGGRPDLATVSLSRVTCPTLLIVGGEDSEVLRLNRHIYEELSCTKKLEIVPHATHLFEEPGTLEKVAKLATHWFKKYL